MMDLGVDVTWVMVTLFGVWILPEFIKPLLAYCWSSVFALAVGAYWWLTAHVIKTLWDTT